MSLCNLYHQDEIYAHESSKGKLICISHRVEGERTKDRRILSQANNNTFTLYFLKKICLVSSIPTLKQNLKHLMNPENTNQTAASVWETHMSQVILNHHHLMAIEGRVNISIINTLQLLLDHVTIDPSNCHGDDVGTPSKSNFYHLKNRQSIFDDDDYHDNHNDMPEKKTIQKKKRLNARDFIFPPVAYKHIITLYKNPLYQ